MAEMIPAQVHQDIEDIGRAVNTDTIITPRYGAPFKSLPMIARESTADIVDLRTNKADKAEVDTALRAKANASDVYKKEQTYTKPEVDSAVNSAVASVAGGNYGFNTLAEFDAAKATIPANSTVTIAEAGENQGDNIWDGVALTKSPYDPLTQAKSDSSSKVSAVKENITAKIIYSSENLFNRNAIQENTSVDTDGTIITDPTRWLSDFISCKPSQVFSVFSGSYHIAYYDENKQFITRNTITSSNVFTVISTSSAAYFKISGVVLPQNIMLNSGNTLLPYTSFIEELKADLLPNIPVEKIPTITSDKTDFFQQSNNLFNKNASLLKKSMDTDGSVIDDTSRWLSDFIPCLANEVFSITAATYRLAYYREDGTIVGSRTGIASTTSTFTVTNSSAIRYMRLSATIDTNTLMLNKGDVLLPLEEFGDSKLKSAIIPKLEASSIPEISPEMTEFFAKSENLFNEDTVLDSTSIDTDGTIIEDGGRWLSDYIPCRANEVYSITPFTYRVAYFREDYSFINRNGIASTDSTFTIQNSSTIRYMRLSAAIQADAVMLNKGDELLPHMKYGAVELDAQYIPKQNDTIDRSVENSVVGVGSSSVYRWLNRMTKEMESRGRAYVGAGFSGTTAATAAMWCGYANYYLNFTADTVLQNGIEFAFTWTKDAYGTSTQNPVLDDRGWKVTLENGVRGTLLGEGASRKFIPENLTEPLLVNGPQKICSDFARYKRAINVLNLGKNNIGTSPDPLFEIKNAFDEAIRQIKEVQGNDNRFIVVGHFAKRSHTPEQVQIVLDANAYLKEKYGNRYIDSQEWMCSSEIWTQLDITPTQDDLDKQAAGLAAVSLSSDGAHMDTKVGDYYVTNFIIPKLEALNYIQVKL